jgi:two-component system phosphate regulon sensor histidine kinase PhoR
MSRVWIAFLGWQFALLILGALLGAIYGRPLAGCLVAAIGLLAWHMVNLYRLERWLFTGYVADLPSGNGLWSRVFARTNFIGERSKTSRKNLRKLVKELRASTKAFPDGGMVLNANNEIISYNKNARSLLGLKKKRDRGQRIDNLIRHPDFGAYLERNDKKSSVEIPSPVNAEVWLSCRLIPYGPGQKLLLIRDVTQSVRLETMRRDFVANASHELRSPLTVIAGYLDVLGEEDDVPEGWEKPLADMREQAERMSQLVRDLLTLSRLESSESGPMDKSVDLGAILAVSRKEAVAQVRHPGRVEVFLESDVKLLGEETEIQSVVSNLVSNAVRYTPADGAVSIRWWVDKSGGHLSVQDTGIGIAEEDIPRLTERFFRADGGRARQQGGTGLGLAIVKHALKRHDAKLEVESKLGQGSTFTCHFSPKRLQPTQESASAVQ